MRGENYSGCYINAAVQGSSPHARGKPHNRDRRGSACRLIPACAGKTGVSGGHWHNFWAHPRMRGENGRGGDGFAIIHGSSPHARGKRSIPSLGLTIYGLIPACAGKTICGYGARPAWSAHPRMRGENMGGNRRYTPSNGSSPHARGKLSPPVGISPPGGSSPHARGKLGACCCACSSCGLIPACAGKTGESETSSQRYFGSSPHARGKLNCGTVLRAWHRLIPACAGKTKGII